MLTDTVKTFIDSSVLCWLATVDKDNKPNVSPKEVFTFLDDNTLIIANIASPNSTRNILQNKFVCVSFVEIFVQKGFKLMGEASIILPKDERFKPLQDLLFTRFSDRFTFISIITVKITEVASILAPSYTFFSDSTTEQEQVQSAMKNYKVSPNL